MPKQRTYIKEKMRIEKLSPKEKEAYVRHQLALISERNIIETARDEGKEEGREEGEIIGMRLTLQIIRLYNQKK